MYPAWLSARCRTSPPWTRALLPQAHRERRIKTEGLSINLATVRKQYGLKDGVEAFVKHGVRGISPWREHVQEAGMAEAGRIIRHNGMKVTGYCRGGLFGSADAAGQQALIDDNKRMIDEGAAIGA